MYKNLGKLCYCQGLALGKRRCVAERAGTAWVDGKNLLGPVVGNFCMDLAVKKAKEAGVGWVSAKGGLR